MVGEELYSHSGDAEPDIDTGFERINVASEPSARGKKEALRAALLAHAAA